MSREIKFRAWSNHDDQMRTWDMLLCHDLNQYFELHQDDNSHQIVLMQYTGLKDKNGKEIYEGDIVEQRNYIKELLGTYEVRSEAWSFTLHDPKKPEVTSHYIIPDQLEVIGNIYEASNV